jgi:LPS-assembly protein
MAPAASTRISPAWRRALAVIVATIMALTLDHYFSPPSTAAPQLITFPKRPKQKLRTAPGAIRPTGERPRGNQQMLVRANEINYDYTNERVAAVGNVQIYYGGSTLEADRVIYDQKTKRLHAEGNVRLTEPDGTVTFGQILNLSDDYRDGFIDSLRVDGPEQTRFAAPKAKRSSGNFTVFESGVYTACEPCKDDPKKPPKWQVKAARIIHDQGEKMMYFENAQLEFFGMPLAYFPYFSAPDPTVKRKTGFLMPVYSSNTVYGYGVQIPYFWAIAPNYDMTLAPTITTRQGLLMQAEWRHRLISGSYSIRAAGIFQMDKDYFLTNGGPTSPGYRDWRGSIETSGKFKLSEEWVWGWEGTVVSDRTFLQDYRLSRFAVTYSVFNPVATDAISQLYLARRGATSYFDTRAMYFYAFTTVDLQGQIPVIHPITNYEYTAPQSVFGGELSFNSNLTSMSRDTASFNPTSQASVAGAFCLPATADPAVKNATNCLLRGVPGLYSRFSSESNWRRTYIDSYGQVFTPFVSVRGDVAAMNIEAQPGVANFIPTGETQAARAMPAVGFEYKYPFISTHSWGTQTIEPIAQVVLRPDETSYGTFPNEDAQALLFDDANLFRVNKFSGWDRVEGGSRINAGVQYTAQVNSAGSFNVLIGQSYHLFGKNSFAAADPSNTGLDSGLETTRSDYIGRVSYRPNAHLTFTSRVRLDEQSLDVRRWEVDAITVFGRWTTRLLYGYYDAQPDLGLLTKREGILASAQVKLSPNWLMLGAAAYDVRARELNQTQIGVGYIDDCLLLAVNYISNFSYSGSTTINHSVMFQLGLRTLGGTSASSAIGGPTSAVPGLFGSQP